MGRPKKPTAHLELVGAFKSHPERKRESEPVCEYDVGPAPDWLTKSQKKAWEYLADSAVPGVLTRMDRAYLELCAISLAGVWDYDPAKYNGRELTFNALSAVGKMLGKLGMTPSDRSNVVVARPDKKSKFADYQKA